jgi:hypothetical protein
MQIHLEQTVDKYDNGYGLVIVHKFSDKNLERINSFSNNYIMNFVTESTVRLYFTLFRGYNVTVTYDFNNDIFYCDFCDKIGMTLAKINNISKIDKIIDKIEEHYIKGFSGNSRA